MTTLDRVADELDAVPPDDEGRAAPPPTVRIALATSLPLVATGLVLGAIFKGAGGPILGALAGLAGLGLALVVTRVQRTATTYALAILGIFAIGLLAVLPTGPDNLLDLRREIEQARASGNLLRPPVDLEPGWVALLGWLQAMLGFTVGWAAIDFRRPATALVLPLPFIALAAISLPEDAQIAYGVTAVVLFAMGLGLLAGARTEDDSESGAPLAFELRRLARSVPVVAAIAVGMVVLAQSEFLFPPPYIDPTREPQKPKTVPLTEVEDRVLFEVDSSLRGPWRMGGLDVYDGTDWRLPPFGASELTEVPQDGIVDRELAQGVGAHFRIRGLGGTVLPSLPNTVAIRATGPKLVYDARNGNIRAAEGQLEADLEYGVVAADIPTVEELQRITGELPPDIVPFTAIPDAPPGIAALIEQAPTNSKWDQFDWLRTWVLDNVVASGPGVPVSITPERAEEIVTITREASPFEIVALQAMLARWIDVAARIGYGFDGGDEIGPGLLAIRPRHGAAFPEVYFPGHKWLPVIGVPKSAKPTVGNDSEVQFDPSIIPSDEIGVEVFLPTVIDPPSQLLAHIRAIVLIAVPTIVLLLALYSSWPVLRKRVLRAKRRRAALRHGAHARIAVAYAEWRDLGTDYGYRHDSDTPTMFVDRFVPDGEHEELAWLVTRSLWGDLRAELVDDYASTAEELSASLRRRLAQAHPATLRLVAAISRLSLRSPYFTGLDRRRQAPHEPPSPTTAADKEEQRELVTIDA